MNPFDWKNQPPKINWQQQDYEQRISRGTSAWVCENRARGHEPSITGTTSRDPRHFVVRRKP